MSRNDYILIREKLKHFEVSNRDIETGEANYWIGKPATLRKAVELANREQEEEPAEYGLEIRLRSKNWRG